MRARKTPPIDGRSLKVTSACHLLASRASAAVTAFSRTPSPASMCRICLELGVLLFDDCGMLNLGFEGGQRGLEPGDPGVLRLIRRRSGRWRGERARSQAEAGRRDAAD